MKDDQIILDLISRYKQLEPNKDVIIEVYDNIVQSYDNGGKMLIAGNGGSASDAEHIAGELMKKFRISRPISYSIAERIENIDPLRGKKLIENLDAPLMAIPLVAHESLITAYMNDADATGVFAQQLLGYGRRGDVFLAISTSGNSENIINAAIVAKAIGIKVIGLSGKTGGCLKNYSDLIICVPETETYRIQELHLPIYHCICMLLENHYFGNKELIS